MFKKATVLLAGLATSAGQLLILEPQNLQDLILLNTMTNNAVNFYQPQLVNLIGVQNQLQAQQLALMNLGDAEDQKIAEEAEKSIGTLADAIDWAE